MAARIVVALGGNALLKPGQKGTIEEYLETIDQTAKCLVKIIEDGYQLVITHGNGPQVGNILIQNEQAAAATPPMPLYICDAESQGQLGFMLQQALQNHLRANRRRPDVVTVVTQVLVDKRDKGFQNPTKPIGPSYDEEEARMLEQGKRFILKKQVDGRWRRVVASPEPLAIVEADVVRRLVDDAVVVVACGGGGIPVVEEKPSVFRAVDAVIDKDLASQLLAAEVGAEILLFLTDVEFAYLGYKKPTAKPVRRVNVKQLKKYYGENHFPAGSMGPKVLAAIRFVEEGGKRAVISSIERAHSALAGKTGTQVIP